MVTIDANELIRAANNAMLDAIAELDAITKKDAAMMATHAAICEPVLMRIAVADRLEAAGYLPTDRRGNLTYWEPRKTVHHGQ